jgi:CRISPR-associated protein Cas6
LIDTGEECAMRTVELHFPVVGETLPAQHGYDLYAALSRVLPSIHEKDCPWLVGPVAGLMVGAGVMRLETKSRLRLRLPSDDIPQALPLAGKLIDVIGHRVRLGVPQVRALDPTAALGARLVLVKIKGITNPTAGDFVAAVNRKLSERGIRGEAGIPLMRAGPHAGQPCRGVLRLKGKRIIGYAMRLVGLSSEESLSLQEHGIGGRRKMGCGFFVPVREGRS